MLLIGRTGLNDNSKEKIPTTLKISSPPWYGTFESIAANVRFSVSSNIICQMPRQVKWNTQKREVKCDKNVNRQVSKKTAVQFAGCEWIALQAGIRQRGNSLPAARNSTAAFLEYFRPKNEKRSKRISIVPAVPLTGGTIHPLHRNIYLFFGPVTDNLDLAATKYSFQETLTERDCTDCRRKMYKNGTSSSQHNVSENVKFEFGHCQLSACDGDYVALAETKSVSRIGHVEQRNRLVLILKACLYTRHHVNLLHTVLANTDYHCQTKWDESTVIRNYKRQPSKFSRVFRFQFSEQDLSEDNTKRDNDLFIQQTNKNNPQNE
ncbi:hypothetical protein WN51_14300 [Melipona quadrifasciata]|uniref:Uncharacterized protein n=1 Tax=Melipona quadrifasciata TaxID=166423 RepID=A0A0M9A3F5_9HYME|nr:hypothetical protein WN51_14300 [Melipona quadrifasciata]